MTKQPVLFSDCEALVDTLLERLNNQVVLGLPLGLGKANHLVNCLFRRALDNPDISLSIFTALTLERPNPGSELERRFLEPLSARLFDDYPALQYAEAVRRGKLPDNIQVKDFFLQPGKWLGAPHAQQAYASLNYTHALDTLLRAGVNLTLKLISPPIDDPQQADTQRYSLSCNPDISADLLDRRRNGELQAISVGQVNSELPYMYGAADRPASDFDFILQDDSYEFPLFCPPNKPAGITDYAIGLQVANLIPDGGSLQIGIGSIGDAITQSLLLRHQHSDRFSQLLNRLDRPAQHTQPFSEGLYGVTEMLVEGFLKLIESGIMRREVDGAIAHAGFFLGSPVFYQRLRDMPAELRNKIAMMPVSFTNQLYGAEQEKRAARQQARFVNSAIMVTLTGAVVSDGLADNQVISGVGGQYNFVSQAFALDGARSIITLPSTRTSKGETRSNICWQYPHTTIPRHLRDMVVTEYGVANLRDKSDADVIAAMINIADSAFQPWLLSEAKKTGKLPLAYKVPEAHRHNTKARLQTALQPALEVGDLPAFPLGSGMSSAEEHLAIALSLLSSRVGNIRALMNTAHKGWRSTPNERDREALQRMQLDQPRGIKERFYRALLLGAMQP
ncbi:MAG: acetyl-CoA hydrolase/transferase C-terminal domain-containing protein [Pseudomonas sp.]